MVVAKGTLSITTTEIYFEVDEDDPAFKKIDTKVSLSDSVYSTGGFVAGSGFQFCLVLNDSGGGEHILILTENKMNEITHALFYGIEEYINFKSCIPEHAHFNGLSVSAFVYTWADLVVKPIAPRFLGYSISGSLGRLGKVS